jgi:hypothetical protein
LPPGWVRSVRKLRNCAAGCEAFFSPGLSAAESSRNDPQRISTSIHKKCSSGRCLS